MAEFARRLPPLDHLVAFEAAARLGSFTLAGDEIAVTQSAVSQRIRQLEAALGVQLFQRGHRSVRLTREGREFQNSVTIALNHVLSAAETLRDPSRPVRLGIATDLAVGALWLGKRLHRFQARHPEIAVDLVVTDAPDAGFAPEIDIAILHGTGQWPGYHGELLFPERIFAVCAPAYAAQMTPGADLGALAQADLLDLSYEHWHWMNWTIWLTELGQPVSALNRRLECNSYDLVIEAARNGQGVALGWQHFVDADLLAHRLVMASPAVVETEFAYYVAVRAGERPPAVAAFVDWVIAERDAQPLFALPPARSAG
ncbi:MAG: LysR substrate-binding domain-containing protein [Pseudomonadota bacterium]